MDLHQCIFTQNNCYKAAQYIKPDGIVVHSTGANNPNLRRYVQPDDGLLGPNNEGSDWNRPFSPGVCVHAMIGKLKDGAIATYQTLPWDMRCWGCAGGDNGSYNNSRIQFEICEDDLTDPDYFAAVYQEAVELCVYLCREYGIDPENISDHHESYLAGYASNHADVSHWFPKYGKSMDIFRADVKEELMNTYENWKANMDRYLAELADKDPGEWSKADRLFIESIGVVQGDEQGRKRYKSFITREESTVMLARALRYKQAQNGSN